MIISKQSEFSNAQVVTADAYATNVIDLGAPGTVLKGSTALTRDIGKGRPIPILVNVTAVSGTSPTMDVSFRQSANADMSSHDVLQSAAQVTAAGRVALYIVPEQVTKRYISVYYDVGGTSPSFTVDAGVVLADQEGVLGGVDD